MAHEPPGRGRRAPDGSAPVWRCSAGGALLPGAAGRCLLHLCVRPRSLPGPRPSSPPGSPPGSVPRAGASGYPHRPSRGGGLQAGWAGHGGSRGAPRLVPAPLRVAGASDGVRDTGRSEGAGPGAAPSRRLADVAGVAPGSSSDSSLSSCVGRQPRPGRSCSRGPRQLPLSSLLWPTLGAAAAVLQGQLARHSPRQAFGDPMPV